MSGIFGTSYQRGRWAESLAMDYLLGKGLKLIAKNYLARCGEIDLIMQDGATLVFFEIRYRADNQYMNALETIDSKKRTHIIHATQHYLQTHRDESEKICRFDVMIIFGHADNPGIRWIKNAFQA